MSQTYGDAVWNLFMASEKAYQEAGNLRDIATSSEKDAYNLFRGKVGEAQSALRQMYDRMPAGRKNEIIGEERPEAFYCMDCGNHQLDGDKCDSCKGTDMEPIIL